MPVLVVSDGVKVEFYARAGSKADSTELPAMAVDLPAGSGRYTNNAYVEFTQGNPFPCLFK